MEFLDLVSNEDLDMKVKIVARSSALAIQIEPRILDRLKWKDRRVKVQISLAPGLKRLRLISANTSGWEINEKKGKGAEIWVRQLAATKKCIRRCAAMIESDALIISLPSDFEPRNTGMILGRKAE